MGALHLLAPTLAITLRPLSFTFEIAVKSFSFPIAFENPCSFPSPWLEWHNRLPAARIPGTCGTSCPQ